MGTEVQTTPAGAAANPHLRASVYAIGAASPPRPEGPRRHPHGALSGPTGGTPVELRAQPQDQPVGMRIAAAKPVVWGGSSALLNLAWPRLAEGRWLVIDLFSGIGGLMVALVTQGLLFTGVAVEMEA